MGTPSSVPPFTDRWNRVVVQVVFVNPVEVWLADVLLEVLAANVDFENQLNLKPMISRDRSAIIDK
jgi:hypothetical protein